MPFIFLANMLNGMNNFGGANHQYFLKLQRLLESVYSSVQCIIYFVNVTFFI